MKSETKFGQIDFEKIVMETTIVVKRSLTGVTKGKKKQRPQPSAHSVISKWKLAAEPQEVQVQSTSRTTCCC